MNEPNELIRLTTKNSDTVERAYMLLEKVDEHLKKSMDEVMGNEIEKLFPGWDKLCEYSERDVISFWPAEWIIGNEKSDAWYSIDIIEDAYLYINCFTATSGGKTGILFDTDRGLHGYTSKAWRIKKENFYNDNELSLKKAGFQCQNGLIFRPFQLDLDMLAESYPDFGADAFQPLTDVLNDIKSVHHLFDNLVAELKTNAQL